MSDIQKDNKSESERERELAGVLSPVNHRGLHQGYRQTDTDTERKSPRVLLTVSHPGVFVRIISDDR